MKLNEMPIFFLDLQTTGAKPESGAHILEIAWATQDGSVQSRLVSLPDGEKIPYRIQMITGIFNEDMEAAVPFADVVAEMTEHLKNPCVIHFAQFEKPFLNDAFAKLEVENPLNILCTNEIAKRLLPNLPTRGIKGLAGYYGYPCTDLKRSAQQVEATRVIWKGLTATLAEQGIVTYDDLLKWLETTPKAARTKYEYPLPKEKRLTLPDKPGVYRMVSRWDEILYVGKATSLKDRVNSYFRGQKNRDPRKLEMLTQVYDLKVTVCGSPLEAALLETDEIKRLDPRYNISLKTGHRSITFFNKDLTEYSHEQSEEHCFGPFSSVMTFDSIRNLRDCLVAGELHENIFFDPVSVELVQEGLKIFCDRHGLDIEILKSGRSILALGIWWSRKALKEKALAAEEEILEEESLSEEAEVEVELTGEDIADKLERHFRRAGYVWLRARELTRILNSDIHFQLVKGDSDRVYNLKVRGGFVASDAVSERVKKIKLWDGLDIDTYDRMSVLLMELGKIRTQKGDVRIMPL